MRAPSRGVPRDVLATSTSFTGHTSVFSAATASTGEENGSRSLLYPFPSDLSADRTPATTFAKSINVLASSTHTRSLWDFRVERDDDDAELGRELSLTGCLTLSSYCGLLRTDCCVFLSSNGPDRRSRPPTRRRYRSSSRVCFPIPSYGYLFVRHTGTLLSPLKVCDARRELLSLSPHTFHSRP